LLVFVERRLGDDLGGEKRRVRGKSLLEKLHLKGGEHSHNHKEKPEEDDDDDDDDDDGNNNAKHKRKSNA